MGVICTPCRENRCEKCEAYDQARDLIAAARHGTPPPRFDGVCVCWCPYPQGRKQPTRPRHSRAFMDALMPGRGRHREGA